MKKRITEEQINELAKHIGKSRLNTLLIGDAGLGKSMIAQRVRDHMPPLTEGQQEVFDIYKAAGLTGNLSLNGLKRPVRAPHHTASLASLIGSAPKPPVLLPKFGELSLAHLGLLILDEIPEFRRDCLEAVARAMKNKYVTHGMGKIDWPNWPYPAAFQLVATANTCPCGAFESCSCTTNQVMRYQERFKMIHFDEIIEIKNGVVTVRDNLS